VSPLPLLLSLALGGALVVVLVLAIRRGIREQAELDELSDLVEYEEADEHFSGAAAPAPSQHSKPTEGAAQPR